MDYTDLARVKSAMDSKEVAEDLTLSDYITRASRIVDRLTVGISGVSNYFAEEDIVDEVLTNGVIDYANVLTVFPHKPLIKSVLSISYRYGMTYQWIPGNPERIFTQLDTLTYEGGCLPYIERLYVKLSYTGGFGKTVDTLPDDLVDITTLMAIRLFKEERSGLGDSIGVAELGTLQYTKAFPIRVLSTLQMYARISPWM